MSNKSDFVIADGVLEKYVGKGGVVIIPEETTEIGGWAFYRCDNLMQITIPENVEIIGDSAFYECNNLVNVTIPENVKSIGVNAFYCCRNLTNVVIQRKDMQVGSGAFSDCSKLRNVSIPDGTLLGRRAFNKCPCLADADGFVVIHGIIQYYCGPGGDVHIPEGVTEIGENAFEDCNSLLGVTIPNSTTNIDCEAFRNCSNLSSVTIPDSISTIESGAFRGCGKARFIASEAVNAMIQKNDFAIEQEVLKKYNGNGGDVVIPTGVAVIDCSAFYMCTMSSVTLPPSVKEIRGGTDRKYGAFPYCIGLKNVIILGKTTIGKEAFYKCKELEEVFAPKLPFDSLKKVGLQKQGTEAFIRHTKEYTDPAVKAEYITYLASQKKKLLPAIFAADAEEILNGMADAGKITKKNLEQDFLQPAQQCKAEKCIKFLERLAIEWEIKVEKTSPETNRTKRTENREKNFIIKNEKLVEYRGDGGDIVIPDGVKTIDNRVFQRNTKITSVTIPNSVTVIGSEAFANCSDLKTVVLPENLNDLWWGAFRGCSSLKSINIPASVSKISWRCFENCTGLTSVVVQNNEAVFDSTAFDGCIGLANPQGMIIVNGILFEYVGAGGEVTVPENVRCISDYAFYDCSELTIVTIQEGVAEIGENAFKNCRELTVILPNSLRKAKTAFSGCVCKVQAKRWSQTLNRLLADCVIEEVIADDYSAFPPEELLSRTMKLSKIETWNPNGKNEKAMLAGLKKNVGKLCSLALEDTDVLIFLCDNQLIAAKDIDAFLEEAEKCNDAEKKALLINYQNDIGSENVSKARAKKEKAKEDYAEALVGRISARDPSKGIEDITFVITGKLNNWSSRAEVKKYLENYGAFLGGSVTKKTDYLVTNDTDSGSEKNKKAKSYGAMVISEEDFNDMIGWRFKDASQISIPTWLRSIPSSAFEECQSLRDVIIPKNIMSIGENAFYGCKSLTSVVIPESVTSIGEDAFIGCSGLISMVIPRSLTALENGVFAWCSSLKNISIPDSVTRIGELVFNGCDILTIHAPAGSYAEQYAKENNIPFVAE